MDKIICPVTLTGDHISPERIMCGYAGNYGIYRLQLSPGEGWEGLDVRVTWETAGEPVVTWPDAEGFVDVPPEATADSTRGCRVATVVGLADGVKRISASLLYSVRRGGAVDGKDPAVPTPDVAEMLLKEMDAKLDVPTGEGQTGDVPVMQADGSLAWGKVETAKIETDETLILKDGVLCVNTTNTAEQDNTKPITSAGVYTQVGNIEVLLAAL